MDYGLTLVDVKKLDEQLRLVRVKSLFAIFMGDSHSVARLTCEAARLTDAIELADAVSLQPS